MNEVLHLEIYKQRYEVYRYLDRLFWQMLQLSAGILAIAATLGSTINATQLYWAVLGVGTVLTLLALAMMQIRRGITKNAIVLKAAAAEIGDTHIPAPRRRGVSFWISLSVLILGVTLVVIAIFEILMSYMK